MKTVLYNFEGSPDGAKPFSQLINVGGELFGTTSAGGAHDYGTIYEISASGAEVVLHRFNEMHGRGPVGSLAYANGELYGTTAWGGGNARENGPNCCGVVYEVSP